jgi:hypothetical protein|nr:MAG TPA: hypothetical protein [Caudoviricetes sp.]
MNEEWLKNLKVGDSVFVVSYFSKSLETVQKVTSKGRIVVNNTLYTNGANRSNRWRSMRLEEATETAVKRYKCERFVRNVFSKLRETKAITYGQAKEINKILNLGVEE